MQVMPGRTLNRRMRAASVNRCTSRVAMGRGPTSDMSPVRTLKSCGSSSMEVRRNSRPMAVVRGSFLILKIGPLTSFMSSYRCCSDSAFSTIVRNLYMRNRRRL